ncbi:OmpH family outer membrane protein [Paracoccus pacificus]|uniref:OmpH family outer membrane protein n=1 Tax=Paracoccus pacificus TaxID=1463598 RepID=A0ABW4R5S4_9RHOB
MTRRKASISPSKALSRAGLVAAAVMVLSGAAFAQQAEQPGTATPELGLTRGLIGQAPASDFSQPVIMSALLTVDQEALYAESAWGKRVKRELEEQTRTISDENERIVRQLAAEERDLTEARQTLSPQEFRKRADTFDTRVQEVRRERDQRSADLSRLADAEHAAFLNAALPLFSVLMRERGALAIMDRRTVFLAADSLDVTADMIARIDKSLGDGAGRAVVPPRTDPAPPPDAAQQPQPAQTDGDHSDAVNGSAPGAAASPVTPPPQ